MTSPESTPERRNKGLYTGSDESSYRSEYFIRSKNSPEFTMTPRVLPSDRTFNEWAEHLDYIRRMKREITPITKNVDVVFRDDLPKMIALIGDPHIGGETDYLRLRDDIAAVKETEGAKAIMLGDVVDGMFFKTGSTQDRLVSLNEEAYMAKAMLDELSGKLIAAWGGDHDFDWASQQGLSLYHDFVERYNAHLMHGIGYIDFYMGHEKPEEPTHKTAGAHRHPGFSIYSYTAASERLQRESAQDCDIVYTGHNHRKGITEKSMPTSTGTKRMIFISVGPYKKTDHWMRKQGYSQQENDQLGGIALILYPNGHKRAFWTIEDGVKRLNNLDEV